MGCDPTWGHSLPHDPSIASAPSPQPSLSFHAGQTNHAKHLGCTTNQKKKKKKKKWGGGGGRRRGRKVGRGLLFSHHSLSNASTPSKRSWQSACALYVIGAVVKRQARRRRLGQCQREGGRERGGGGVLEGMKEEEMARRLRCRWWSCTFVPTSFCSPQVRSHLDKKTKTEAGGGLWRTQLGPDVIHVGPVRHTHAYSSSISVIWFHLQ